MPTGREISTQTQTMLSRRTQVLGEVRGAGCQVLGEVRGAGCQVLGEVRGAIGCQFESLEYSENDLKVRLKLNKDMNISLIN